MAVVNTCFGAVILIAVASLKISSLILKPNPLWKTRFNYVGEFTTVAYVDMPGRILAKKINLRHIIYDAANDNLYAVGVYYNVQCSLWISSQFIYRLHTHTYNYNLKRNWFRLTFVNP